MPIAANAGYYAEIVAEKAILRRLVEAGTRIVQFGYSGADGQDVAEVVVAAVEPFQARMADLMGDPAELDRILAKGAERATEVASRTRNAVYDAVGVLAPAGSER